MTMTNEQLSEAVKELEQCFSAWDSGVRVVGNVEAGVALQVIRQLWAERDQHRAVMAQAREALASIAYRPLCGDTATYFCGVEMQNDAKQALAALESMGV